MALNLGKCNEVSPAGEQGTEGHTGVHNTYASHYRHRSEISYNHCVYKCYQQQNLPWYNHAFPIISLH